ncbi:DUF5082 family protein [Fictibacillus iocasae]|uniref:DUF5082 family protein n=1 Tax=Fictibacillus iocasae TaxID=2715437 RepID=A0ABW2NUA1_9BACL
MELSYLYARLREKQEQLQRMQDCQRDLSECQQAFQQEKHLCTKPELTSVTWEGVLAKSFDNIRENGILSAYEEIEGSQFDRVFQAIASKISSLHADIQSINEAISAARLAQMQLKLGDEVTASGRNKN